MFLVQHVFTYREQSVAACHEVDDRGSGHGEEFHLSANRSLYIMVEPKVDRPRLSVSRQTDLASCVHVGLEGWIPGSREFHLRSCARSRYHLSLMAGTVWRSRTDLSVQIDD